VSGRRWTGSDPSGRTAAAARTLRGSVRFAGRRVLRTQTDQRLVELAQCGSEPAFETIVERYRGPLRRYCRRFVPSSRVDDVLQQAFFDAYRAIHQEGRSLELRPWLFRVTHNVAIDTVRQESRGWKELRERPHGVGSPDQATEKRESLRDLMSTLRGLPEQQRVALVLREMEGRSYEEISRELGVSQSAVGQLLARARHGLQAGASAVVPAGVLLRLPGASGGPGERVTELVSAAGGAAGLAKAAAVIAVAGAVGGTMLTPGREEPSKARDRSGQELVQPFKAEPRDTPQFLRAGNSDSGVGRLGRGRSKPDRTTARRPRTEGPRTPGGSPGAEPLAAPEDGPDDDELEPGAELEDDDGPGDDDGNPDPPPSPTSGPEADPQDVESMSDSEPVPDIEPVPDVDPDLDAGD
jgi:RNA polymerase sigma factor (sigma-70 family)